MLGAARNVAAGGEPIGLSDCLNFNPESRDAYELARGIAGVAGPQSADPVVSGNVSLTTTPTGARSADTGVGCVGLAGRATHSDRMAARRWLLAQAPGSLAAEAALVRFLWKAAPILSLCHDVGYAGLEHSLAEAARWSGHEADVELPEEPSRGAAILATTRDQVASLGSRGFVEIGRVR